MNCFIPFDPFKKEASMRTFRNILLIIFIIIPGVMSFCQTPVPGGPVSGIWIASGSPYFILGEISIPSGKSLIIEPGVRIEFQGHYKLNV